MKGSSLLKGIHLLFILTLSWGKEKKTFQKLDQKIEQLAPCEACKVLVTSFQKGMSETNKNHFGGGDTAWEEEKLGDYARSEVRLIEIQENLCSDVLRGQFQCYSLAEEWEQLFEEWWFKVQERKVDIFQWLCIENVQYCCPENHFGPECKPCNGLPNNVCSNNGRCKGAGTRKGNGECLCNDGYKGYACNECADSYYQTYAEGNKLLCLKCHNACKSCSSYGTQGCTECNRGWQYDSVHGCLDIDECAKSNPCKSGEVCVNNNGSYKCLVKEEALDTIGNGWTWNWIGYLVYIGLYLATCVFYKMNKVKACVLGLSIAIYVSWSQYMSPLSSKQ